MNTHSFVYKYYLNVSMATVEVIYRAAIRLLPIFTINNVLSPSTFIKYSYIIQFLIELNRNKTITLVQLKVISNMLMCSPQFYFPRLYMICQTSCFCDNNGGMGLQIWLKYTHLLSRDQLKVY